MSRILHRLVVFFVVFLVVLLLSHKPTHAYGTTAQDAWQGACISFSGAQSQLNSLTTCDKKKPNARSRLDTVYFKLCKGQRVPGVSGSLNQDWVFPAMACTGTVPASHASVTTPTKREASIIIAVEGVAIIILVFYIISIRPSRKFAKFEQR